jgi:hypothetical protein
MVTIKKFIAVFTFFSVFSIGLFAQPADRQIVNQSLQWFSIASNIKLNNTVTVYVEGQFRYADNFDPMQYQARTALDITLNKHWSFVPLGYVYTWNYLYGKQPASFINNEHRVWQQLMYKHKFKTINLSHRFRVEERFIEIHTKDSEGVVLNQGYDNHQTRFRYRFMATMPLKGEKIEAKSFFAGVYDEVFVSRGKLVTFHEPDQNRIFAGLGYQFNSSFNILAGPLYQLLIKSNGAKQENNVGVQVMATYNFDLSKKE